MFAALSKYSFVQHRIEPRYSLAAQELLWKLFSYERCYRELILQTRPGSEERQRLMQELYAKETFRWYCHLDRLEGREVEEKLTDRTKDAASLTALLKPGRCLEAGAGSGALCRSLALRGWQVDGLDVVESPFWKEIEAETGGAAHFTVGSLASVSLPEGHYDLCLMDNVLEHFPPGDYEIALLKALALLRPGGWLALVVPNPLTGPHDVSRYFVPPGQPAQGCHFNERRLWDLRRDLFRAGFRNFKTPACGGLAFGRRFGWSEWYFGSAIFLEAVFRLVPAYYRDSILFQILVTCAVAGQKPL
jgi:2-polyprenyl-3-methyl-5-hydroxy-6-metoxy-1,4-benzoquinol methylase